MSDLDMQNGIDIIRLRMEVDALKQQVAMLCQTIEGMQSRAVPNIGLTGGSQSLDQLYARKPNAPS